MHHRASIAIPMLVLVACAGPKAANSPGTRTAAAPSSTAGAEMAGATADAAKSPTNGSKRATGSEFVIQDSHTAKTAHGVSPSKIEPTATEAALKFFVIDKDKGPIKGIVISLRGPSGHKYYTQETDAQGYTEVLVPVGQKYDLVYLSLGRRDIAAKVAVSDEPRQHIKLTLRYKRIDPPAAASNTAPPGFVLDGVNFDSGKAKIRAESLPRLDTVVEYMMHKKSARIEISGYTDSAGNPKVNKALSEKRAQACRDYLVEQGIDAGRIIAIGYGDQDPIASNDTQEGREKNRRIEAKELQP